MDICTPKVATNPSLFVL